MNLKKQIKKMKKIQFNEPCVLIVCVDSVRKNGGGNTEKISFTNPKFLVVDEQGNEVRVEGFDTASRGNESLSPEVYHKDLSDSILTEGIQFKYLSSMSAPSKIAKVYTTGNSDEWRSYTFRIYKEDKNGNITKVMVF